MVASKLFSAEDRKAVSAAVAGSGEEDVPPKSSVVATRATLRRADGPWSD